MSMVLGPVMSNVRAKDTMQLRNLVPSSLGKEDNAENEALFLGPNMQDLSTMPGWCLAGVECQFCWDRTVSYSLQE
jgi:hypothetical protein